MSLLADGRERRLGAARALEALLSTLKSANSTGTPELVKEMAVSCLDKMRQYKRLRALHNNATRATLRARSKLSARLGSISADLSESQRKLQKRLIALDNEDKEHAQAEMLLRRACGHVFHDCKAIVSFFRGRGFGFSKASLMRRANGECLGMPGCPTAFTEAEEQMLLDTVMARGDMGMPMSSLDVCEMAWRFASEATIRRFRGKMPGERWYRSFVARMKASKPAVAEALERGMDIRTIQWFNEANVIWWYGCLDQKLKKYGFGQESEGQEGKPPVTSWREDHKARVIFSDETAISGYLGYLGLCATKGWEQG